MDILVCYKGSDFAKWGTQFNAKDQNNRSMVLIDPMANSFKVRADSLKGIATAAKKAQNGRVIIALGHGGGDATDTSKAMVDLGRKKAFRIQQETLNYDADELKSDKKQIQFAISIKKQCSAVPRSKRNLNHKDRETWKTCLRAKADKKRASIQIDIRDKFLKIGNALRSNRIKQVIFLSCNVGRGKAFLNKLGKQWGVKVTGYKHRLAIGKDGDDKFRVYFLKDKKDGQGSNTRRSRTELPPMDQSYTSGAQSYQPGQRRINVMK